MELTVGPNQFFWSAERWASFYDALASAPVDRVVLGELVCSKRLPFYQARIPDAVATLLEAGKQVSLTSLALVTLKRERKQAAELSDMGVEVEINDLTALTYLPENAPFSVGPLVNVYNEGTLSWLASRGAKRVCLPPELPLGSVSVLAKAGADLGVAIEVWGHGRVPLAISGRCYHARMHGRAKDNCQFACEDDADGLDVRTLEDQPFLTMNGVQTLSDTYACAVHQIDSLKEAGVTALRLSPQSNGFVEICQMYRDLLEGEKTADVIARDIQEMDENIRLSDGFLTGDRGVDWSGHSLVR
ncbi:ubiquinone anaerobic biosynthesis protein UbiV [Aliiroseovarius lamellibrachiae]|uniref:ubiquinone anaerobic biosynthesis protein UbiV n=1 Tax=Aliiroseovarius lamellibrachiae TaxID=1924933 RepID=UPI001BE008CC|nr:U32 family peptidase [Aliiroseovarius lamellibrachiae]MBT2130599.1 U32 family peptidase [Aliiroseovarius lamellibrachiae]